jgi:hypothetical protein
VSETELKTGVLLEEEEPREEENEEAVSEEVAMDEELIFEVFVVFVLGVSVSTDRIQEPRKTIKTR